MSHKHIHNQSRRLMKRSLLTVSLLVGLAGVTMVIAFIYNDLKLNQSEIVEGEARTVAQVLGNADSLFVSEENFEFELPGDWREIDRINRPTEQSITWQATSRDEDNRWLKLYKNTIPDDPIVRLLPVTVNDNRLQRGQLSAHCATFTGSNDNNERFPVAKWEDVEFRCDANRTVNVNIIGTGQRGQPFNTFEITGVNSGTNRYFFVYTDQNIRPNFDIFYNAVGSFRAK